jgi:NADH pyrophosphatase NudC (nudix superfamily)
MDRPHGVLQPTNTRRSFFVVYTKIGSYVTVDSQLRYTVECPTHYVMEAEPVIAAVCAALTVGFLAGLLSFKVKCRWCPECGATTLSTSHDHRTSRG